MPGAVAKEGLSATPANSEKELTNHEGGKLENAHRRLHLGSTCS